MDLDAKQSSDLITDQNWLAKSGRDANDLTQWPN